MNYISDVKVLFDNLNANVKRNKFFTRIDKQTERGMNVTIFTYYLGSYTDWCFDGVRESRGIMFEMDSKFEEPIRIACRPMEKFFNFGENPLAMFPLKLNDIVLVQDKADGSLISTYIDSVDGLMYVKSKGSIDSVYALNALEVIKASDLYDSLELLSKGGYTVNMEYVSPNYRIVLPYEKDDVIIFNVRDNISGEYLTKDQIKQFLNNDVLFDKLNSKWVETYPTDDLDIYTDKDDTVGFKESLDKINRLKDIMPNYKEGFVIKSKEHGFIKIKGKWYTTLHHLKDSVNSNKALFQAICNQVHDDIMANFLSDEYAVKKIITFEKIYTKEINRKLDLLNKVKNMTVGIDNRKDYVMMIKDVLENDKIIFNIMMLMFDEKDFDLMDNLNDDFMRNFRSFVPDEYFKDDIKEKE